MAAEKFISIIIPNYNGEATIGKCLEAAFSSKYHNFEVIVVDDSSRDDSVKIIEKYPCRLIRLDEHSGASRARNIGAQSSKGKLLFFIDADCLLEDDTLSKVNKAVTKYDNENRIPPLEKGGEGGLIGKGESRGATIIGGTYTKIPYDNNFFSTFQSVFINYSETKHKDAPDYIATHAMAIDNQAFKNTGGFSEGLFIPILEDVEFSHRLRRSGYKLVINPGILVRHIFHFNFFKSLRNAFKKSMYWTIYSIMNRDLLMDSGTASIELKADVLSFFFILLLVSFSLIFKGYPFFIPALFILMNNLYINRRLIKAFYEAKGLLFALAASCYYTMVYPLGVGVGAFAGTTAYFLKFKKMGKSE